MKPILCIDVTLDKKNEQFVGDEFITASTPYFLLLSTNFVNN